MYLVQTVTELSHNICVVFSLGYWQTCDLFEYRETKAGNDRKATGST